MTAVLIWILIRKNSLFAWLTCFNALGCLWKELETSCKEVLKLKQEMLSSHRKYRVRVRVSIEHK